MLSTPDLLGGVERESVTFPLCRDLVDRWVLVEEEEIAQAVYYCLKQHKKVSDTVSGLPFFERLSADFFLFLSVCL